MLKFEIYKLNYIEFLVSVYRNFRNAIIILYFNRAFTKGKKKYKYKI